jgi:glucose-1-phosphate thymidylyltransferase
MAVSMKAIILAAGYATRLYPLTQNLPKSLLPIGGRPLIEYTIEKILACPEIDTIYIATNSKFFGTFQTWMQAYTTQAHSTVHTKIEILDDGTSCNEERIGSVADLWYAIDTRQLDDDLLVLCSDKMFEFTLVDFVDSYTRTQETLNTVNDIHDVEKIRNKRGCAVVDEYGRITDFEEKPEHPKSTLESVAFYIFPRRVLPRIGQYLDEEGNPDAPGYFTQWLISFEPVYAFVFKEPCYDVGNVDNYREVDKIYTRMRWKNR